MADTEKSDPRYALSHWGSKPIPRKRKKVKAKMYGAKGAAKRRRVMKKRRSDK